MRAPTRGGVSPLSRQGYYAPHLSEVWTGQVALPARNPAQLKVLQAFLAGLHGRANSFGLPVLNGHFNTSPAVTGTLTATAVPGAETLTLSDAVTVGTLFSVGSISSGNYQVFEVFAVSGLTVSVSPRVRYGFASGAAFTSANVKMKMRLLSDADGKTDATPSHGMCTLNLVEVP